MQADIIIVGAGAAGLMAAKELSATGKKVVVLEARDRIGGRAYTEHTSAFSQPIETGAEFIHGNLKLTLQLLEEAGTQTLPATGEVWRSKNGSLFQQDDFIEDGDALMQALEKQKKESSVGDFLKAHLNDAQCEDLKKSVQNYIEGYYAGELNKASVLALKEEWKKEEEPQRRVQGGYTKLMEALYNSGIENGTDFYFSSPVKTIAWAFEKVEATTANGQIFTAQKIIITTPVPVLLNSGSGASIHFQPQITEHIAAIKNLGHGNVVKIVIEFKTTF